MAPWEPIIARHIFAENVVRAICDAGGVVVGPYVRNYIAYKAEADGAPGCVWDKYALPDVPETVDVWACHNVIDDIKAAIEALQVQFVLISHENGREIYQLRSIDVAAAKQALWDSLPAFVDRNAIVHNIPLPENSAFKIAFRPFYGEMRPAGGRVEDIDYECNSLCIYEGIIQPTFGEMPPYENMKVVRRITDDIIAGRAVWIGEGERNRDSETETLFTH